jgi:probable phosphoglycerate mutase
MDHAKATTRFGLIRHAETVWNREKRIQGQQDSPLTPEGEMMADSWGRRLAAFHWDRILASDTGRAKATAERINAHLRLPIDTHAGLRELDWGRWTTRTVAQLWEEEGDLVAAQDRAGWDFQPPGGESRRSQLERSRRVLLEAAGRWPGHSILVVTHEGVIKGLVHFLAGTAFPAKGRAAVQSYRLHWISVAAGRFSLDGLNSLDLDQAKR